jgi:hypothetical protein
VVYLHNGELHIHKKNEILSLGATWMEMEIKPHTERQIARVLTHLRKTISQSCRCMEWNSNQRWGRVGTGETGRN